MLLLTQHLFQLFNHQYLTNTYSKAYYPNDFLQELNKIFQELSAVIKIKHKK